MTATTRRDVLTGLVITAALGNAPATALSKGISSRAAWNTAIARVRATSEAVERTGVHCKAAHVEAESICPREGKFFTRYNLGITSRRRNLEAAYFSILTERHNGENISDEDARDITAEANRVVDEFDTYCAKRDETYREYNECEDRFDTAVDAQHDAREALLHLPAPDHEALLEKIDLLALMMREMAVEDAERIAAIKADPHRLLKAGRA